MMNKYLVSVWVEEVVSNLRTVWIEADSFTHIQAMNNQEFEDAIDEFDEVIDQDWGGTEPDKWDLETIELNDEHSANITPSDEKPDVEDIDPNAGRGK